MPTLIVWKKNLKKYLNWEGIINYTNSILDEYKLGGADGLEAYLQEEGIFGYAYDILAIIEDEEYARDLMSDYDDEDDIDFKDSDENYENEYLKNHLEYFEQKLKSVKERISVAGGRDKKFAGTAFDNLGELEDYYQAEVNHYKSLLSKPSKNFKKT